jgi:hypothetical protein
MRAEPRDPIRSGTRRAAYRSVAARLRELSVWFSIPKAGRACRTRTIGFYSQIWLKAIASQNLDILERGHSPQA